MTSTDTRARDYIERVKAALADLPDDEVAEVVEDLTAHVAEVLAEADAPGELERRLGTPEEYAAELRAAGGYPPAPGAPGGKVGLGRFAVWTTTAAAAVTALAGLMAPDGYDNDLVVTLFVAALLALPALWVSYSGLVTPHDIDAVPERRLLLARLTPWTNRVRDMRGAWRLARIAILVLAMLGALRQASPFWMFVLLAAGLVLIILGPKSDTDRRLRPLIIPANTLVIGLGLALALHTVNTPRDNGYYYPVATPDGLSYNGTFLSNIFAVDRNGTQIPEFYLFDQNGNPLNVYQYNCEATADPNSYTNRFPAPVTDHGPTGCTVVTPTPFVPLPPNATAPTTSSPTTSAGPTTTPPTTTTTK